jgi:ATP-binding cassette subfamily E protein 1
MEKSLGDFKLKTGEGKVHQTEVVGVVGPNGTGKSTMVKILAGEYEYDAGWVTADATVSYKPQHIDVDMDCTVQTWLDSEIGISWRSGEFNVTVIRALGVDELLAKMVNTLSGGEAQAVAIAICLGREADLYLLDEPSAHLDANARMETAKAIRRTMESNEKSAFVIDHDVYFIDIVSDTLLVFEGEGGRHGMAEGPFPLREGMNRFLAGVDVTFRRDHDSKRPRINKAASRKDREQRNKGDYYSFDS